MNILRWLLKHPIMLAWLLAVIAILLNFSIGGRNAHEQAQEASTEQGQVAQQTSAPAAQEHIEAKAPEQAQIVPVEPAPVDTVAQQPVVAAPADAAVQQQAATVQAPADAVVAQQPAAVAAPSADVAVQQPVVQAPADTAAQQQAAQAPASAEDLLLAAREAYWSNELDSAAGFYQSLLKQVPDSIEYKGELANVYWKQGNAKQAAELFTEVAPKLAAQGRTTEALNMKLYVDMVDPELSKKIDAAMGK